MRNVVIGFLAGSVVTSAVLLFVIDLARSPSSQTEEPVESLRSRAESSNVGVSDERSSSTDARGAAVRAGTADSSESRQAAGFSSEGTESASVQVVDPAPALPELAELLQTRNGRDMRSRIEAEPLDPLWGSVTEFQLSTYYSQRQEVMRYGVPAVQCRSSTCEIQLVAYGATGIDTGGWLELLASGINQQPWGASFRAAGIINGEKDGAATVLMHLVRIDPDDATAGSDVSEE